MPDDKPSRVPSVDQVAENAYLKLVARLAMAAIPFVIAGGLYLARDKLAEVGALSKSLGEVTGAVQKLNSSVQLLNYTVTRNADDVKREINVLTDRAERDLKLRDLRIDEHERRIDNVERIERRRGTPN